MQLSDESTKEVVHAMVIADVKADGDLNYILFKFFKYYVKHAVSEYDRFCKSLISCAIKIEDDLLGPYEDKKIEENGDV